MIPTMQGRRDINEIEMGNENKRDQKNEENKLTVAAAEWE